MENAVSDANQNLKKTVQKTEISSESFAEKAKTKFDQMNITATVTTELTKNPSPSVLEVNRNTKSDAVLHRDNIPANEARDYLFRINKSIESMMAVKN